MRDLQKIDALVASRVMGWNSYLGLWRPSLFIEHAWEVVEKLEQSRSFWIDALGFDGEEWRCVVGEHDGEYEVGRHIGEADTAPLAICLAALAACGVEVPNDA